VNALVRWLQGCVNEAGAVGLVVGLSGGIDSAVTAALGQRAVPGNVTGVAMPIHSRPEDVRDAQLVAESLGIPLRILDLSHVYDLLKETLLQNQTAAPTPLALANLKPRLRMLSLYFFANQQGCLVAGTGNRSELAIGYFTKH